MELYYIFFACIASTWASSIVARIDWENLKENDYMPPLWQKYFLENPPPITEDKNRIVGGQIASPNAYPYQVGMGLTTTSGGQMWCGGSIISQNFMLSAAHCLENVLYAMIILGAHDRESALEPGRQTVFITRNNFIVHAGWNMQNMINDIALLRFTTPIVFTNQIQPISLPSRSYEQVSFEGHTAVISGWGNYEGPNKQLSKYLRFTHTQVVGNTFCKAYFQQILNPSNICLDGSQGRGTCHGDSGGPLVINVQGTGPILAGLTSFGNPYSCEARWPTVFTRITSYLTWISMYTGIAVRD